MTCKDCQHYSHCLESSREYPCKDFRKKVNKNECIQRRKTIDKDDRFTFEDSQILNKLRESDRLTEREKLAVQRLYRTYQYMVD